MLDTFPQYATAIIASSIIAASSFICREIVDERLCRFTPKETIKKWKIN